MSIRVYAWDANPAIDRFLYRCSGNSAQAAVDGGRGRYLDLSDGHRVLQLYEKPEILMERGARNLVLVLARILNPLQHPPRLHYPIPKAGDYVPLREMPRGLRRGLSISHRHRFNRQPLNGTPIRPE